MIDKEVRRGRGRNRSDLIRSILSGYFALETPAGQVLQTMSDGFFKIFGSPEQILGYLVLMEGLNKSSIEVGRKFADVFADAIATLVCESALPVEMFHEVSLNFRRYLLSIVDGIDPEDEVKVWVEEEFPRLLEDAARIVAVQGACMNFAVADSQDCLVSMKAGLDEAGLEDNSVSVFVFGEFYVHVAAPKDPAQEPLKLLTEEELNLYLVSPHIYRTFFDLDHIDDYVKGLRRFVNLPSEHLKAAIQAEMAITIYPLKGMRNVRLNPEGRYLVNVDPTDIGQYAQDFKTFFDFGMTRIEFIKADLVQRRCLHLSIGPMSAKMKDRIRDVVDHD